MAIFSNKIIEAYYVNAEKTAIEIIYKDGEKAISHYLSFDPNHPDFKDLIKEYSLENILETTTKRLNAYREQLKNVVQGYQQNALKNAEESLEKITFLVSKRVKCIFFISFRTFIESIEIPPPTTNSKLLSLQTFATSTTYFVTAKLFISSLDNPLDNEKSTLPKTIPAMP